MSNRVRLVVFSILVFLLGFFANDTMESVSALIHRENVYTVTGIVTMVDGNTATIVDEHGEAWLYNDASLKKCDSVSLMINDNGTIKQEDDTIVSVNK